MASFGNKKVSVMSHGEVQAHILKMDNKIGSDGKALGEDDGNAKNQEKIKQASMKGMMDKQGSGSGKFD